MRQAMGSIAVAMGLLFTVVAAARAELQILPTGPGTFYLGGEGGWTRLPPGHVSATIPVIGFRNDSVTWTNGINAGVRGGYEWGPWRVEEEVRYQRNSDRKLENSGGNGNFIAVAALTNLIYDFLPDWFLSPHIGGGIGPVLLSSRLHVTGLGQVVTGTDWVFGYQALGGMRFRLGPVMTLDVDYR